MKRMRKNWNLFIVCFLCVLCFLPHQVNAQAKSQKKITIEISNERLPSVLKRLEKISGYKILLRTMTSKSIQFPDPPKTKILSRLLILS